jgi:hypothetical protein
MSKPTPPRILKFPLPLDDDTFLLDLPVDGNTLYADVQNDVPCLWVAGTLGKTIRHRYRWVGTGHDVPEEPWAYITSFLLRGGAVVFHLFEDYS